MFGVGRPARNSRTIRSFLLSAGLPWDIGAAGQSGKRTVNAERGGHRRIACGDLDGTDVASRMSAVLLLGARRRATVLSRCEALLEIAVNADGTGLVPKPVAGSCFAKLRSTGTRRRARTGARIEHDPEKACPGRDPGWISVFGRDRAPTIGRKGEGGRLAGSVATVQRNGDGALCRLRRHARGSQRSDKEYVDE